MATPALKLPPNLPSELAPWTPSAAAPWNLRRAGHLARRVGCGPTLPELDTALTAGYAATLARYLAPPPATSALGEVVNAMRHDVGHVTDEDLAAYQGFWLYRLAATEYPLEERLALFWHGTFSLSFRKVRDAGCLYDHYETCRRLGRGRYADLLAAVARDPAMLLALDGNLNHRAAPNESFARELLGRFTVGPTVASEADVAGTARVFTGWELHDGKMAFNEAEHDPAAIAILGLVGNPSADELLLHLARHPATAQRLARRLLQYFVMPDPPAAAVDGLAAVYLANDTRVDAVLAVLCASTLFHSDAAYRALVRSPVELAVATLRALDAGAQRDITVPALRTLGQELFNPPEHTGWPAGAAWLTPAAMLARTNYVTEILLHGPVRLPTRDHLLLQRLKNRGLAQPPEVVDFLCDALLHEPPPPAQRQALLDYYSLEVRKLREPGTLESWDFKLRRLVVLIMSLPEYHLV